MSATSDATVPGVLGVREVLARIVIMAEMHGRDMVRRHVALGLLVLLPLAYYLSSTKSGRDAVSTGGVAMAFAVGGATLFSTLSAAAVDQRLVLMGYRPVELLLARLAFLWPLGVVISGGFTGVMIAVSHPADGWIVLLGVSLVALQAVPFGLAIGSVVPRELEGTLVLIGVVGIQMAVRPDSVIAKVLPFYGPRRLIEAGIAGHGAVAGPLLQTALYGVALFAAARLFTGGRLSVQAHARHRDRTARPGALPG